MIGADYKGRVPSGLDGSVVHVEAVLDADHLKVLRVGQRGHHAAHLVHGMIVMVAVQS